MVEREGFFVVVVIIDIRESTVRDDWKSRSGREVLSVKMGIYDSEC